MTSVKANRQIANTLDPKRCSFPKCPKAMCPFFLTGPRKGEPWFGSGFAGHGDSAWKFQFSAQIVTIPYPELRPIFVNSRQELELKVTSFELAILCADLSCSTVGSSQRARVSSARKRRLDRLPCVVDKANLQLLPCCKAATGKSMYLLGLVVCNYVTGG